MARKVRANFNSSKLNFASAFLVSFVFVQMVQAERIQLPQSRNVETDLLETALKVPPDQLISFIESQGVKVFLYPSRRPKNPQFKSGQMIAAPLKDEQSLKDVFEDSGSGATVPDSGVFTPPDDQDLGRYGTFIVIAESASSHTLLHEFTHYLFYRTETGTDRTEKYSLLGRAMRSNRNLGLQFKYSFSDLAGSDRYKRDNLVETLIANIGIESERVRWFVAEEIFVESILAEKISAKNSLYFTPGRIAKGAAYAAGNIKVARIELAQRMNVWQEMKHGFMKVAGLYPGTSTAEREEIVTTIPQYQEAITKNVMSIETTLVELEQTAKSIR